jgi:hypothetical protein
MVIPTLNEAAHRGALLERLSCMRGVGEVVVANGDSTDSPRDSSFRAQPAWSARGPAGGTAQRRSEGGFRGRAPFLARRRRAAVRCAPDKGRPQVRARRRQLPVAISRVRCFGALAGRFGALLSPAWTLLRGFGDLRQARRIRAGGWDPRYTRDGVFVRRMEGAGKTAYLPGPSEFIAPLGGAAPAQPRRTRPRPDTRYRFSDPAA